MMNKPSQKEKFIREIERRIISGELCCGDMLPPERELAAELEISRTVVHTGLAELSSMGFVRIKPRKGYVVTDFQNEGTIAVLESIMHYNNGNLAPDLLQGLLDCRVLVELETASLAAVNRTAEDLNRLKQILQSEKTAASYDEKTVLDFAFHHAVAVASGNSFYPLILKSFQPLQMQLIRNFYSNIPDSAQIYHRHEKLILEITDGRADKSVAVMKDILKHGEAVLKNN